MRTLAQNAAKCEKKKRCAKCEKSGAKYPITHFLFFLFRTHFRVRGHSELKLQSITELKQLNFTGNYKKVIHCWPKVFLHCMRTRTNSVQRTLVPVKPMENVQNSLRRLSSNVE